MGSVTATYKVPKRSIEVRVFLRNREERRLTLFAPLRQAGLAPEQEVARLLTREARFLPGRDLDDDRWLLVNRDAVVWVTVIRAGGWDQEVLDLYDHHSWVRVSLFDGSHVQGELFYTAPSSHARVVDHLNRDEAFLTIHRLDLDQVTLVNKTFVVGVAEQPGGAASNQE